MLLLFLVQVPSNHAAVDGSTTTPNTTKPALPQAADLAVHGLGDLPHYEAFAEFDGDMYAGTLPSNNGNRTGEMMFWMFEPHHQEVENTIIL
jgi:hypothetical protein